jgi:predicted secreted hydrolase
MDREWSTSILGAEQIGWDWFALQLDDGSDLMFFQIRLKDGSIEPMSSGTIVAPDGTVSRISRDDIRIEVLDQWASPTSRAAYPSRWRVTIPQEELEVTVQPYIANQELPLSILYWEGAVNVSGTRRGAAVSGNGYIEMTGYAELTVNDGSGRVP